MALDGLQAVIKSLQNKIEQHYAYLSSSETRTRQVLIDPLLKELGWDVSDPSQVELEYSAGTGGERADYALIANGKPAMVVEAKSLKTQLGDRVVMQALNYANSRGIAHMIITNGDEWRMYDVFAQKAVEERVLIQFSLSRPPVHENVLKSLASRDSKLMTKESISPVRVPEPSPVLSTQAPVLPTRSQYNWIPVSRSQYKWIPLSEVVPVVDGPTQHHAGPEPKSLRFGGGGEVELKSRIDLPLEVANWLADRVEPEMLLNFSAGRSKPISRIPDSSRGPKQMRNGMYFHLRSYYNLVRVSKQLLDYCGYDVSKVYVWL